MGPSSLFVQEILNPAVEFPFEKLRHAASHPQGKTCCFFAGVDMCSSRQARRGTLTWASCAAAADSRRPAALAPSTPGSAVQTWGAAGWEETGRSRATAAASPAPCWTCSQTHTHTHTGNIWGKVTWPQDLGRKSCLSGHASMFSFNSLLFFFCCYLKSWNDYYNDWMGHKPYTPYATYTHMN